MKLTPITPGGARLRYMALGSLAGVWLLLTPWLPSSSEEPLVLVFHAFGLCGLPILILWNGWVVARRKAYTEAIEQMRPLAEIDDDTLVPEEIDPLLAKPTAAQIFECSTVQFTVCAVFVVVAFVAMWTVAFAFDL